MYQIATTHIPCVQYVYMYMPLFNWVHVSPPYSHMYQNICIDGMETSLKEEVLCMYLAFRVASENVLTLIPGKTGIAQAA